MDRRATPRGMSFPDRTRPEPTKLTGPLADYSLRVAFDGFVPPEPAFGAVTRWAWGGRYFDAFEGNLMLKGDSLELHLHDNRSEAEVDPFETFQTFSNLSNQPIDIQLANGFALHADFGNVRQWGSEGIVSLHHWHYSSSVKPIVWFGNVEGVVFNVGNLSLGDRTPTRSKALGHNLRLEGNYIWHLIATEERSSFRALLESSERTLDPDRLRYDFRAMELALGVSLKIERLVGFDEAGALVAGVGLDFGFRPVRGRKIGDGPVPDRFDTSERWIPVFFNKLALKMGQVGDVQMQIPIAAYLDAYVDHIDGAYLKAQIALEAFCKAIYNPPKGTLLVKNAKDWMKWVDTMANDIRVYAIDGEAGGKLLNKVKSAMNRPTTDAVEDALTAFDLKVPSALLEEVRKRNTVAHGYTMNKAPARDIQEDVRRLAKVKTLLIAAIACFVGYDGLIAGWERGNGGWLIDPDWWPAPADRASALKKYFCMRLPHEQPSEGRAELW